jgi:hypothetical protein
LARVMGTPAQMALLFGMQTMLLPLGSKKVRPVGHTDVQRLREPANIPPRRDAFAADQAWRP